LRDHDGGARMARSPASAGRGPLRASSRTGLHGRRPATGRRPHPAEPCVVPRAVTSPFRWRSRRAAHAVASDRPCSGARPHALPRCGARRGPRPRKAHAPAAAAGPAEGASAARRPATRAARGGRPSLARRNRWERERGRDRFTSGRATTRLRRAPAAAKPCGGRTTSPSEDQLPQPGPRRAALPRGSTRVITAIMAVITRIEPGLRTRSGGTRPPCRKA
jgi:hypothetical protein